MAYNNELAARVRTRLREHAVLERKMFGGLTFLVNGNMCCGILEDDLVLRLGPGNCTPYLEGPHVKPMDITGKPLDWMIRVQPPGYASDRKFNDWIERALAYVSTLPRKLPKASAPRRKPAKSPPRRAAAQKRSSR